MAGSPAPWAGNLTLEAAGTEVSRSVAAGEGGSLCSGARASWGMTGAISVAGGAADAFVSRVAIDGGTAVRAAAIDGPDCSMPPPPQPLATAQDAMYSA